MNLNERLAHTTQHGDPSRISTQDKPSFSSNVSPNSSSQPSEQPSILRSIQELTVERNQARRELQDKNEELQEMKQFETMYLNALRENDDLRNECGILTRKQVNEVLAENARLKEEIDANRY